jgi:hypothetical protein
MYYLRVNAGCGVGHGVVHPPEMGAGARHDHACRRVDPDRGAAGLDPLVVLRAE